VVEAAAAVAAQRAADEALGVALADLARLIPQADLLHLRDTLKAAKERKQHGRLGLECELSFGRVTDAWVTTRFRAGKGVPVSELPRARS
jgi:hypothetical protein